MAQAGGEDSQGRCWLSEAEVGLPNSGFLIPMRRIGSASELLRELGAFIHTHTPGWSGRAAQTHTQAHIQLSLSCRSCRRFQFRCCFVEMAQSATSGIQPSSKKWKVYCWQMGEYWNDDIRSWARRADATCLKPFPDGKARSEMCDPHTSTRTHLAGRVDTHTQPHPQAHTHIHTCHVACDSYRSIWRMGCNCASEIFWSIIARVVKKVGRPTAHLCTPTQPFHPPIHPMCVFV